MEKEKVWNWFLSLSVEECALVMIDHNEEDTKLLRSMYLKRESSGEGFYFANGASGFCFRKISSWEMSTGAIIYPERVRDAERRLIESVRLCDTRIHLDSLTVTTGVLEERESFLDLLSVVSKGGFLCVPCQVGYDPPNKKWKWESPKWFLTKGYYTLAEFLTAWMEKIVWRRFCEANRIDPRKQTDHIRPFKPSNASLSTVLDSRKTRLKSFWYSLNDDEKKKLATVKMGSVMTAVVTSIEQTEKVNYFKMLKALLDFSRDKATNGDCLFDEKLLQDPVKFIEFLYLSPLDRAGKVQDMVMRHIGTNLQNVCADRLAMDWINSEEKLKSKASPRAAAATSAGASSERKKEKIKEKENPFASSSIKDNSN